MAPKEFVESRDALSRDWTLQESLAYTKWLATSHYENFQVVSFLLPKHLHQDFYNVYAFCRWADDLGDEIGDTQESLRLLSWWRAELKAMYRGRVQNPVFTALSGTAERHHLPELPFDDLIKAFEQDQVVTRYRDYPALLEYCKYSANPVGRLVLYLCGYSDAERQALSDATCTGLQLANFWQDVTVDWQKDRVYLPGASDEDIAARRFTPEFRDAMVEGVRVARGYFEKGLALPGMVDRRLAIDLELFSRGGMRVLDKIEGQGYDVLKARPSIGKVERLGILLRALLRRGSLF
ncbi:MAG: squalene synthase HpnC [Acidobacteria bacterium]|nr:squalene synthase HpnC [Acidobacteriota bacterium]